MHPPADRVTESLSTLELGKMDSAEYSDIFSLLKGVLVSNNYICLLDKFMHLYQLSDLENCQFQYTVETGLFKPFLFSKKL